MSKKVVFIAGPYRADTVDGIYENIQRARAVAKKWWAKGYVVICPHMNTAMMDGFMDDEVWLDGAIEIMKRCDLVVMVPGYAESKGALQEKLIAEREGIEVTYDYGL